MFNPNQDPPPPVRKPFQHCLSECQMTPNQIVAIQQFERITTLTQFSNSFTTKTQIDNMAKRMNSGILQTLPLDQIGQLQIANLHALWDWLFDCKRQGSDMDHTSFNLNTITYYQDEAIRETAAKGRKESELQKPPKLVNTTTGWIEWVDKAENYLRQIPGCVGSTLAYVIRDDSQRPLIMDSETSLLYGMRLDGPNFRADNIKVYQLLNDWLRQTDAWVWMQQFDTTQNGRGAVQSLRDHYDGPSHILARINYYKNMLKELTYRSEQSRPFQNFVSKIKEAYQGLADCKEPYSERNKVDTFLEKIHCPNNMVILSAKTHVQMLHAENPNFESAINIMTQLMQVVNPSSTLDTNNRNRNVSQTNSFNSGRFQRGRGNRGNRGGRTHKRFFKNIDITDASRTFTREEWSSFPEHVITDIQNRRSNNNSSTNPYQSRGSRGSFRGGRGNNRGYYRGGGNRTGQRNISAYTNTTNTDDVSQITNYVNTEQDQNANNASNNSTSNSRTAFGRSAYQDNASRQLGTKRPFNTSAIISSSRRITHNLSSTGSIFTDDHLQPFSSTIEIDNHADTHCFGKNFTPISFDSQVCDVTSFSSTLPQLQNIRICNAATAYDDPISGTTTIIEITQGLWMADYLDHSLINPNQCRAAGIDVHDNPYCQTNLLSIFDPNTNFRIPLNMRNSTAIANTRAPTLEEIHSSNRKIVIGEQHPWDPNVVQRHYDDKSDTIHDSILEQSPAYLLDHRIIASISSAYVDKYMINELESSIQMLTSSTRHSEVTPEILANKWRISLDSARNTLHATTQLAVRHAQHPLRRRYRTDLLLTKHRRLNCKFYSDTMFSKFKSLNNFTCAQVFVSDDVVIVYPLISKSQAGDALTDFLNDILVPTKIVVDGAQEQVGQNSEFRKTCRKYNIYLKTTEAYTPKQNRAELYIGELKRRWRSLMNSRNVPKRLWSYGIIYQAEILSRAARGTDRRTGIERLTGDTPDISEWLDFGFYDLVWYWDAPYTKDDTKKTSLGRWLGVSHHVGSQMSYWILTSKGKVVSRTTVQHVTTLEASTLETSKVINEFDEGILKLLSDESHLTNTPDVTYIDDELINDETELEVDLKETDDYTEDTIDELLNAEFAFAHGGVPDRGRVIKRIKDNEGRPIGRRNENPLFDTRKYEIELRDGTLMELTANSIIENIYSHCDTEGREHLHFSAIIDHRTDGTEIKKEEGYTTSHNGNQSKRITTKGWSVLVEWRDGTTSWLPIRKVKDSNPVELAEYAVRTSIDKEPAFAWWVHYTLDKRKRIIAKVKSRYWNTKQKFGIQLPHSVEEALRLDVKNGNTLWRDAIEKEMKNARPAFRIWLEGGVNEAKTRLVGYQHINCHMIFDIKMENFTRKARFVAGGHTTVTPDSLTYSSVVARDSVRIAFLVAALHGLQVFAADVGNAYLNAKCRERIWTIAGPEFGSDQGKVMIIEKALYGLKSSGAALRSLLASTLTELGYKNSIVDYDVWIKAAIKPDGFEYYEYVLVYVDDILHVSHQPHILMEQIGKIYRLKEGSVGPPDRYLGANISLFNTEDSRDVWSISAKDYLSTAVKNIIGLLAEKGLRLKLGVKQPLPTKYRPELDSSPLLQEEEATQYQHLLGVLRWACELGRMDILLEVSWMSAYNSCPREGHLDALYHIFAYLNNHLNTRIVFDSRYPIIDESRFMVQHDWTDYYKNCKEELPPNMPSAKGRSVKISCYVDANHGGNLVTRRSQTGFIIFINNSPIIWYSKRQNTVESSTFGSEFVAQRTALEAIKALRYKLRMFGLDIDGPADVYCDNQSVVNNVQIPSSTLTKKHNAINYHAVREAVAAGIIRVAKEDSSSNYADIFTKQLPVNIRNRHLGDLMY